MPPGDSVVDSALSSIAPSHRSHGFRWRTHVRSCHACALCRSITSSMATSGRFRSKWAPVLTWSPGFWAVCRRRCSMPALPTWGNAGAMRPFAPIPPAKPLRSCCRVSRAICRVMRLASSWPFPCVETAALLSQRAFHGCNQKRRCPFAAGLVVV